MCFFCQTVLYSSFIGIVFIQPFLFVIYYVGVCVIIWLMFFNFSFDCPEDDFIAFRSTALRTVFVLSPGPV